MGDSCFHRVLLLLTIVLCLSIYTETFAGKIEVSETGEYVIIKHPVYEVYWTKTTDMGYVKAFVDGSSESLINTQNDRGNLFHASHYLGGWKNWGKLRQWSILEQTDDQVIIEYISDDPDAKRYICRATYNANVIYIKHEVQIKNRLHKESITAFESRHDPIFEPTVGILQMMKWDNPIAHTAYWTNSEQFAAIYSMSGGKSYVWDCSRSQPELPGRIGLDHNLMKETIPPDSSGKWLVYYVAFGDGSAEEAHKLAYTIAGIQPSATDDIGSISGTVRIRTGKIPIANATIQVWDYMTGDYIGGVMASPDGLYKMDGLPSGIYRIRVDPHRRDVLETYYSDSIRRDKAYGVRVVAPNEKQNIDFDLQNVQEQGFILNWLTLGPLKRSSWDSNLISVDFFEGKGGEANINPSEGDIFDYIYGGAIISRLFWEVNSLNINGNNLNELYNKSNNDGATAYLVSYLRFSKSEDVDLWLGSDDSIAVWINGEQVWLNPTDGGLSYDDDKIRVSVKSGWNTIIVKVNQVRGPWGVAVRFPYTRPIEISTEKPKPTPNEAEQISISTSETQPAGEPFWVDIQVGNDKKPISDLFGISLKLKYTGAEIIDIASPASANILQEDFMGDDVVFFTNADESRGEVSISITRKAGAGGVDGYGTLAKVNFVSKPDITGEQTIDFTITDISAQDSSGNPIQFIAAYAHTVIKESGIQVWPGDTDNNGVVDERDVLPIGMYWAKTGPVRSGASSNWNGQTAQPWEPATATYADANGDGIVDERDVLPIGMNWHKTHEVPEGAPSIDIASVDHARYIDSYRALLASLETSPETEPVVKIRGLLREIIKHSIPENTMAFQNYPNPFNPETWIPYQLRESSEVTIRIYSIKGELVRELRLGTKTAGSYISQDRAAHWDGRSKSGQQVSSGVYFYHFEASQLSTVRKMTVTR